MATIEGVRGVALSLPRTHEALVRDRVKFRVGQIVYLAFSRDEALMGFAFPKEEREALVASEPDKFIMPELSDLRYNWAVVRLGAIDDVEMREIVIDAWRMVVPKRVAAEHLGDDPPPGLHPRVEEHPNARAYRRTADAFRAQDVEALGDLMDDVVWHVPGTGPLAGEVRGRDALFDWFRRLREVTDGTFTLQEHDVVGNDEHVVALSLMGAVRDGIAITVPVISVFHYRNGRQQERWFHPTDLAAWDRMLS